MNKVCKQSFQLVHVGQVNFNGTSREDVEHCFVGFGVTFWESTANHYRNLMNVTLRKKLTFLLSCNMFVHQNIGKHGFERHILVGVEDVTQENDAEVKLIAINKTVVVFFVVILTAGLFECCIKNLNSVFV